MSILDIGRQVMAVCQPLTGERAEGALLLKSATASDVNVERGRYFFPIVGGQVRHELAFKAGPSDAADRSWTVEPGGTEVDILSNIGGARHNLPEGTRFVVDQPLKPELMMNPTTPSGTTGGADPTLDLALFNFVQFEYFGSKRSLELFQSDIGGRFPAAIMHWLDSEPSDGLTTSSISRPTHRGPGVMSYTELFEILVVSSRSDAEAERRGQALRVLEEMSALLFDRQTIDGEGVSSPGGIFIRSRFRSPAADDGFYKVFQVYGLRIAVQSTLEQRDLRVYSDLLKFKIDAPREDHPDDDLPVVVENLVANPQS